MNREIIFIHVPKTGGITLRKTIPWLIEAHDWGHCTAQQIAAAAGLDRFKRAFKIAFIRHPLARLVSTYHYFKQMGRDHVWYGPNRFLVEAIQAYPDFGAFARRHVAEGLRRFYHLRFQHEYISVGGRLIVDFLGRTETMQADVDRFSSRLGMSCCSLPRLNCSRHRDWESYYTKELRFQLEREYRVDLGLWLKPRVVG